MTTDLALPDDLIADIFMVTRILLDEGCKEIFIFGSIAKGTIAGDSDIDIATIGHSESRFFKVYGRHLTTLHRGVDLVALDYDMEFGRNLRETGMLIRVA